MCSVCAQSGISCEIVTEKAPRGPKKGYLQALRNRIGELLILVHSPKRPFKVCMSRGRGKAYEFVLTIL